MGVVFLIVLDFAVELAPESVVQFLQIGRFVCLLGIDIERLLGKPVLADIKSSDIFRFVDQRIRLLVVLERIRSLWVALDRFRHLFKSIFEMTFFCWFVG